MENDKKGHERHGQTIKVVLDIDTTEAMRKLEELEEKLNTIQVKSKKIDTANL